MILNHKEKFDWRDLYEMCIITHFVMFLGWVHVGGKL